MEAYVCPPQPLSESGDMAQNWQRWKKDFLIFLKASNNSKKSKDLKAYLLRSHIGKVGQDAIDKIIPNNSKDKDDVNTLLAVLDTHFNAKNKLIERYNFNRSKRSNESIEDYINDLKNKAATCNFGNMKNSLIIDKVIVDVKDENLRQKLFETQDLDLLTLITIFKEHETIMQQKSQTYKNIAEVKKNITDSTHIQDIKNANNDSNTIKLSQQSQHLRNRESKRHCWKCKEQHPIRSCPAWGFKCEKCGERNHYTYCCQNINDNHGRETKMYKTNTNIPPNPNVNLPRGNLQYPGGPNTLSGPSAPSAPQLFEANNVLYPNLNYVTGSENRPNSNAWSWVKQKDMKANDNFQKTEVPQSANSPPRPHITSTPKATVAQNKEKDSCKIS